MTQEEVAILWKDANGWDVRGYKNTLEDLERFAKLVAQRQRDKLTVMFLEAHEGAKNSHNYWQVAANKIKEQA